MGKKRTLAVFGAGLSGLAAAKLAKQEGFKVDLFDENIEAYRSDFYASTVRHYDQFVFSPGFSHTHPWRRLLENHGSVYGELGFAAQRWKGKIIGVTGTNGKTTLTRFLEFTLRKNNLPAHAVGNIGQAFSDLIGTVHNHEQAIAICEISSFQAELLKGLNLEALLWTNFSEDHLDRYEAIEAYFEVKLGLLKTLSKEGAFFVGEQNLLYKSKHFWTQYGGLVVEPKELPSVVLASDSVFATYPQRWNFNLAYTFLKCLGVEDSLVYSASKDFKLDAHRLHLLCEHKGSCIWEDSKSTNLHSVLGALERFDRPVIWIGGGASKNESLSRYAEAIAKDPNVTHCFLYGEVGSELATELLKANHNQKAFYFERLGAAIQAAVESLQANAGVELLFSPGFASFDQFSSYGERGKYFSETVFSLLKQNPSL